MGIESDQAVSCRMTVDLYCPERDMHRACHTSKISLAGLFVVGLPCLRSGARVTVTFGRRDKGALQLPCRVSLVTMEGVWLEYENPAPAELMELKEIIWPHWDGEDLLEGLLVLSNWEEVDGLAGWLKLTHIAESWHQLTMLADSEFRRNIIESEIPPRTDPVTVERLMASQRRRQEQDLATPVSP